MADVAIIGAGVIGLACAVQLRRAGVDSVVLIERNDAAGMGSTARANGGVRAQFSTRINIEFSQYTIEQLDRLNAEHDGIVGLRRVGYLFMSGSEHGEQQMRGGYELQRSLGVPVHWLSADGVGAIAPYVRSDGLRCGTFCPTDGIVDPHGVVSALLAECRRLGTVDFRFGMRVTGIDVTDNGITLETTRQRIEADYAVNAAGPGASSVAAMAGVALPVTPFRRNLACTEPVSGFPEAIPMCVDVDTGVLIRREAGGFLIAYSEPHDDPTDDTSFDPTFLDAIAERIPNRFPFLTEAAINERKCWAGLYPETPDHQAIIDAPEQALRFIQCAGFGGHGIMHSLAAGQAVAELITSGRSQSFDMYALGLCRLTERDSTSETAVL